MKILFYCILDRQRGKLMLNKVKKIVKNQLTRKVKFLYEPYKIKAKSEYTAKVMQYANLYNKTQVDKNYIIYQVRDGQSMTDSPFQIFKYLLENNEFKNFFHIWVVNSIKKQKEYTKNYKDIKNIKFIVKESNEYLYYLVKCKYIINNATFPAYFTKKQNQIYINTWHGTPLKHMGFDIENNIVGAQNTMKNFLSSDFIITPNSYTTVIFKKAFKLKNINDDAIVEVGYPRIDATFNTKKEEMLQYLKSVHNNNIDDSPILLYSPTWRGENVNAPDDNIEELIKTVNSLNKNTDYQVLLKVHPFIYEKAKSYSELNPYLIDDNVDTNELLSIVDLLVTDYSSIFFDFLVTKKPIIFYIPDYEFYQQNRGLYLDINSLPGPSIYDVKDLINTINNNNDLNKNYSNQYNSYFNKYASLNDGNVTKRVVNHIFKDNKVESTQKDNEKESILIYPGGMKNNGITTSIVNLLDNIDYEKYDVTIFTNYNTNAEVIENLNSVNENVRIILRKGPLLANIMEYYRNLLIRNRGVKSLIEKKVYPKKLYKREFRKIFGNSTFDYAIDFSGYAMFWSELILASNAVKKSIYMHSDMKMDMNRNINGTRPHYLNLKGVISLYPFYDNLVSVSEITKQINKNKISNFKTRNKFASSNNTINVNKINKLINENNDIFIKNNKEVLVKEEKGAICSIPFEKSDYKIMAMGRLSPEKGFENLIISFKKLATNNPNVKLYILGDGPLKNHFTNLIKSLKLTENVFLLGQKRNPFFIMKKCDLFVLPSFCEGQSMVLLEAMTVGINILASNIPANDYVLENGKYGMLTDNDIETLENSIQKFIDGNYPEYETFNPNLYNKEAIKQFYNLL